MQGEDTGETTDETTTTVESTSGTSTTSSGTAPRDGGPETDASVDASDSGETSSSSDGSGATSSSSAMISCGVGETVCGTECVRGNSCCETKCEAPNAETECRDQECVVVTCMEDFVDCDGEFGNGCELSMAAEAAPSATEGDPLLVPQFDYEMGIADIDQAAWADVPRYVLAKACSTCESSEPPPEVPPITPSENRGVLPKQSDVRGTFALAWNDVGIWVNVVIVDDEIVAGDDVGENDPRLYDDVMVIWDSAAGESDSGSGDDRLLFAGVDAALKDWRQTSANGASVRVTGVGQCRSVHLQLSPAYLFMGSGGGSQALDNGDVHGINIGYNDFDPLQEDARSVERQHLVFGLPMTFTSNRDYFAGTRTLPQIELAGP